MAVSVRKIQRVQMGAQLCVAIGDTKRFKLRSKNVASVNFIGVAMLSVKPA